MQSMLQQDYLPLYLWRSCPSEVQKLANVPRASIAKSDINSSRMASNLAGRHAKIAGTSEASFSAMSRITKTCMTFAAYDKEMLLYRCIFIRLMLDMTLSWFTSLDNVTASAPIRWVFRTNQCPGVASTLLELAPWPGWLHWICLHIVQEDPQWDEPNCTSCPPFLPFSPAWKVLRYACLLRYPLERD